jgi:TrmH family RNA methyltransferase
MEGAEAHPLEAALGLPGLLLPEARMRDLTEMKSPPAHALVVDVEPEPRGPLGLRVIGAWGIQDPGNLGAILRSAAAFGFDEALLGPGCADPFDPKALRGSMGAAFLVSVRRCDDLEALLDEGHWIALDGGAGAVPLGAADLSEPLRLLVGNEGHGWRGVDLPSSVIRAAIPTGGVESLNAAVAMGIACFEAARRRP